MAPQSVTVKQIQDLDRIAINDYGVPSLTLMENAGRGVASEVLSHVKRVLKPCVCVVCGLGNNAGDGFVVARHLLNAGVNTQIYLIGEGRRLKHDAAVNYWILKKCGYRINEDFKVNAAFYQQLKRADIIVDAIFGVGLNREVLNPFRSVIESLNAVETKIVAVDIPSGLDGTSGAIYGVCVKAVKTITFSFVKKGFLKKDGPDHVGKVVVIDIGIPERLKKKI